MPEIVSSVIQPAERPADGEAGRFLDEVVRRMSDPRARTRLYACLAAAFYLMAILLMIAKVRFGYSDRKFDFAPADGKLYYAYIVAAMTDGSIDSTIAQRHWDYRFDPASTDFDSEGHLHNVYPIGVSLTVAPSFLVAHVLTKIAYAVTGSSIFLPNGYTILYQLLNLGWVMLASWATFVMLDRLMVRHFGLSGVAIAIGVLGAWIGTQYTYHMLRFPLMSVVFGPFWATGLVYCAAGAVEKIRRSSEVGWHWAGMSFCFAMAFECRNTDIVWSLFGLYPLYLLVRHGLVGKLAKQIPWMALSLLPIVLQMLVWHAQSGHYLTVSYGRAAQFYWMHPAFWQIMFSARAGLLLWCPVWTMGTVGAIVFVRSSPRSTWILGLYLLTFLIIWYVNSAYWAWPFSNYPNRAFVEWIGLPTIGLALLFHHGWSARSRRQWLIALLLAGICATWLMSFAYDTRRVRRYGDEVNAMGPIGARYAR